MQRGELGHYYQWMWGDAGQMLFGHGLAEIDPMRWSNWLDGESMIKYISSYNVTGNTERPVELRVASEQRGTMPLPPGHVHRLANITVAVEFIRGHEAEAFAHPQAVAVAFGAPQPKFGPRLGAAPASTTAAPAAPAVTTTPQAQAHAVAEATAERLGSQHAPSERHGVEWRGVLIGATLAPLLCCCYICCRAISKSAEKGKEETTIVGSSSDSDNEDEKSNTRTAPALCGDWEPQELRRLLEKIEKEETSVAVVKNKSPVSPEPTGLSQAEEAAKEVERVLSVKEPSKIFGSGTAEEKRAEFRRLVRLLHPDKKHVSGDRAGLALRRIVENQP